MQISKLVEKFPICRISAALMTHQDVDDAGVLPDQIPADVLVQIVGSDGAYDTKQGHAVIAARGAQPPIPQREGAMPWPERTPGAGWRNGAITAIAKGGRSEWKKCSGYRRRSLVENLMYRLRTLKGNSLCGRDVSVCRQPESRSA
ncbi:hypothetical protein LMG29542_08550 [Paraburkholderia humisilvae]|uniref:Uncharacterized protein n=1 Tax=Paraburkholderia humisilvae TaxID=627669 RepID=A0A6J5F8D3_9BURK|nr:hypothetical protein LMG29542_08550 [Paraburkholderia humisilvae]